MQSLFASPSKDANAGKRISVTLLMTVSKLTDGPHPNVARMEPAQFPQPDRARIQAPCFSQRYSSLFVVRCSLFVVR